MSAPKNETALPPKWVAIFGPGLAAVRKFYVPFLILQSMAVAIVGAYYASPSVARICLRIAALKASAGLVFSAVAAAAAGAVLPEIVKRATPRGGRDPHSARDVIFALGAFAFSGLFTDVQYRGMTRLFGSGTDWQTVLKKVAADQFITTPLYGTTYWVVVYLWRRNRYRPLATIRRMTPAWYLRDVVPLLVTGWAYWIPMCLALYSLPGPLQFLLFCFALAAWSLLMVFIAENSAGSKL